MNRILILNICIFLILSLNLTGQEKNPQKPGLSLGFDVYGLVNKIFEPSVTENELSLTAGGFKRFYFITEAGVLNMSDKTDYFHYYSNGQFARFGFDYNFYKRKYVGENSIIFIGFRYGIASLNHNANDINIDDAVWGNYHYPKDVPSTKVNAQWIEITGGMRIEVFKNFSMGWSIRLRKLNSLTTKKGMEDIKPFIIPGFGDGNSSTAFGFNYSLFYTIPL